MKKIFSYVIFFAFLFQISLYSSESDSDWLRGCSFKSAAIKSDCSVDHSMRNGVPCFVYEGVAYPAIGAKEGKRILCVLLGMQRGQGRDKAIEYYAPDSLHFQVEKELKKSSCRNVSRVLEKVNAVNAQRARRGITCSCGQCKTYQEFYNRHLSVES